MLLFHYKNQPIRPVFREEFESEIENSKVSIIWPESDPLTWHTYIRSGQYPVKINVFFLLQNKPTRPSFSWGIRIWNRKQHSIYYLTFKWPCDLICLNCQVKTHSKLVFLFHNKNQTIRQLVMRNSNLESKIARDQLFDLKETFWLAMVDARSIPSFNYWAHTYGWWIQNQLFVLFYRWELAQNIMHCLNPFCSR